jgi:hypothetical protein
LHFDWKFRIFVTEIMDRRAKEIFGILRKESASADSLRIGKFLRARNVIILKNIWVTEASQENGE